MWIVIEKNGAKRKVQPGENFDSSWKPTGEVIPDPHGEDPTRELMIESANLLAEIDADLAREGRGPGDWIRMLAKPVARLLGKEDCVACDVRGAALNAYRALRAKHGKEKARQMTADIIKRSFTEQPEVLLRELKEAIEG